MSSRGRRTRPAAIPEGHWRGGKPAVPGGRRIRNNNNDENSDQEKAAPEPNGSTSASAHAQDAEMRGMAGNRYLEMKDHREAEKERFIAEGLMQDSYKSYRLEDAITLVGLCMDMCPEFERHEREYQQSVDRWEAIDPNARPRRIDHVRAVKAFKRPTQGTEPLPSDLRPLPVLQKTLDYLFHTLLAEHGLAATHEFIWDRTRAIRREFVIQRLDGPEVAEILERIARYHALCLFRFSHLEEAKFSIKHEREQLDKSLQSLLEVYDDGKKAGHVFPHEAEFIAFRNSRQAFYAAFDKIRASKTPLEPALTDPSVVDIIDGYYEPAQQISLPQAVLSGIPIHASLGAAPGAYVAKSRPGPVERPYSTSTFREHAPAAPLPAASQTAATAFQPASSAFATAPTSAMPPTATSTNAFGVPSGSTTFFGSSSIFGKGPFGQSQKESTLNPAASAFMPAQWPPAPAASAFSGGFAIQASTSSSGRAVDPTSSTDKSAISGIGFTATDKGTKASSSFAPTPTGLFATSSSSWPASGSLLAKLSPSQPTGGDDPEVQAVGVDDAQAALADEESRAAEEAAEAEAAAAEAEAVRQAHVRAELAAAQRAEFIRRQEDEKEKNRLREQELKAMLQQREERRRAEEQESELQRRAEEALAAAAETARRQAEADAFNAKMQEEMMRRLEMPLIAEEWNRARMLRKMWNRWTDRAVQIALLLEQREQLQKKREEFRSTIKDLVAGAGGSPVQRRIARMRKNSTPISDDDRARALEEESARHARLWAPGSFLSCIQGLVGPIPLWEVWLSVSSSDGASSAWLKTKFGIDAGDTDVHRITVHDDTSKEYFNSPNSPGLLVLEVSQDSDADCRRLRQIVQALPEQRHYAISLLLVKFTGSESEVAPSLKDLIRSLGNAGTLADARVLVLSATQDMDKQFLRAVSSLKLDLTGSLVQRVSIDNYASAFFSTWQVMLHSWVGLCTDFSGFNWSLYGPVMTVLLPMLNEIVFHLGTVAGTSCVSQIPRIPTLDWKIATDSPSAFKAALDFLSHPTLAEDADAQLLKTQLAEAAAAGVDFPIYAFPERLSQVIASAFRASTATRRVKHLYLPKGATADSVTDEFRTLLQNQLAGLEGLIRYSPPSPASPSQSPTYHDANGTAAATATLSLSTTAKKRSMEDTEWEDDANFVINGYVHGGTKRVKTGNGHTNETTPSPTRSDNSLMSGTSISSTKRGARLRAMMDKMRASLRGEDTFAEA